MITSEVHQSDETRDRLRTSRLRFTPPGGWSLHRLSRRSPEGKGHLAITLRHSTCTALEDVGQQLWGASLLLCDFLLHKETAWRDLTLFEVGGGVGLVSIIASLVSDKGVYYTDHLDPVLNLARENVARNSHIAATLNKIASPTYFRIFDWKRPQHARNGGPLPMSWDSSDTEALAGPCVFLAADVIYDDGLTELLFEALRSIVRCGERIYFALEKRYNFTLSRLQREPTCYAVFRSQFHSHEIEDSDMSDKWFTGRSIDLNFPQRFLDYERTKDMELWELIRTNE